MSFVIEDDIHAEIQDGTFATLQEAMAELERRAKIPWDEWPNQAPCQSWRTCGRCYAVIEYDDDWSPPREVKRSYLLEVSPEGATWLDPPQ